MSALCFPAQSSSYAASYRLEAQHDRDHLSFL